jgi:hypothetical protein
MDKNANRVVTTAVVVALIMLSLFGTIGLTAIKARAISLGCSWDLAPGTGKVGDRLFFQVYHERTEYLPLNQQGDQATVKKPDGSTEPIPTQWSTAGARRMYGAGYAYPYVASFYYTFETAGDYIVSSPSLCYVYRDVHISGDAPQVGDETTTGPPPSPTPSGGSPQQVIEGWTSSPTVTPQRGNNSSGNNSLLGPLGDVVPNILSNIPFFSSGSKESNSSGGSMGSSSGGLMWIFALGAVLLIAAILAFVWWSRREHYEENEWDEDDEY